MSMTGRYAERGPAPAGNAQAGHTAAETVSGRPPAALTGACYGTGGAAASGAAEAALRQVLAGLLGGVGREKFGGSIEAGHQALGNRAFVGWVSTLHTAYQAAAGHHGVAAQGPEASNRSWTHEVQLQMMGKKKKKQGAAGVETGAKEQADPDTLPGPGEAATGENVASQQETPAASAQPGAVSAAAGMPGETGNTGEAGMTEGPGPGPVEKPRKKSRVQEALNTLRGEGVAAFGGYMEAEIGETDLLRTLVKRITRAEDLGERKAGALGAVARRLHLLDPQAGPVVEQADEAAQARVAEIAVAAPVKTPLEKRERDLFDCCIRGNAGRFRYLRKSGRVDINVGCEGGTFLCYAAYFGHMALVRELLSIAGIDVNLAHPNSATPLYLAAQQNLPATVRLLLDARGINVNLATSTRITPLYVASDRGHTEVVRVLLGARGIDANLKNSRQETPLGVAAQKGYEEVVKLLLDAPNIIIDTCTDNGTTPLYFAAQNNFPRIAECLVRRGGNVNLATDLGYSPLATASFKGYIEVVRLLLRVSGIQVDGAPGSDKVPLVFAAQEGHIEIARMLLRNGADPNRLIDYSMSPLHLACLRGHTAIVQMLLHAGADMDAMAKSIKGRDYTLYAIAELAGRREMMSVLAAYRRRREKELSRIESLPIAEGAVQTPETVTTPPLSGSGAEGETDPVDRTTAGTAAVYPTSIPSTGESASAAATAAARAAPESSGQTEPSSELPALPASPLAQARDALRQAVLGKLGGTNFDMVEGIRLLQAVNDTDNVDALCVLYNRLAHIERREERARRQGRRRKAMPVTMGPDPAAAEPVAPVFALGGKTGLDADAVEDEIRKHLEQAYHRFVGQAVNDMEFGRGKATAGYPGLWHSSAGVAGAGSCSVFYYLDAGAQRVRVVGIGHHVGRAAYRLDYATGELGGPGRILRIA